ncbi:Putative_Fe-S cluster assembly factor NAR1 [Hexamita inflata]|uniref:Putative_Fe-S cluster assembly factor NAR1 n=1 Tax=Hexamita inflata TaxID=28002 RepID=A0ABP1H8S7_9EUKA
MSIRLNDVNDFDSKECLVPVLETTGVKLRSHAKQETQVLKISLADCITCSGCITSAEEVFISQSNMEQLRLLINGDVPMRFLLSTPSILSISVTLNISSSQLFDLLNKTFPLHQFTSESTQQQIWANALVSRTLENLNNGPQLVTHCPAVRLFLNKRCPELLRFMTNLSSPFEMFLNENENGVGIQQCQDRKLEAFRWEKKCFTSLDLINIINENVQEKMVKDSHADEWSGYQYVNQLMKVVGQHTEEKGINKDQTVYKFTHEGKEITLYWSRTMKNLENLIRKKNKIQPNEIYYLEACPRGCFGGANLAHNEQHPLQEVSMQIHNSLVNAEFDYEPINIIETKVVAVDMKSPEEIAREKGIKVADMQW